MPKSASVSLYGQALVTPLCARTHVTVHPSAILRMPEPATKEQAFARLVDELHRVHRSLAATDEGEEAQPPV